MIKDKNMELAIKEAKKAALRDEIPIGAIIKEDSGKVIAKESNKIIELCDPTAHAEINAIRIACTVREDLYLSDCTMYVTLEPCSMCLGAIINSRLKKLVYGLPSPKYGAFSSNHSTLKNTEGLIKNTEVYGGFYQSEISLIMREFFEDKRTRFDGNRH
jgi:tRNA(adenine34) deaminase|tara:strand:- start:7 stop:483 length:477 start_codon:yes stop_codon:yes gene_type:complete